MAFVRTVPEEDATGLVKELYERDTGASGYVQNYVKALSLHPEIVVAYRDLITVLREGMCLRRYELITMAVSAAVRCSY